jgi:hypothetical protein
VLLLPGVIYAGWPPGNANLLPGHKKGWAAVACRPFDSIHLNLKFPLLASLFGLGYIFSIRC